MGRKLVSIDLIWSLFGRLVMILLNLCSLGNVLLLKNNLNLSSDVSEVSLQKLLSLVAERLIDSNSNVQVTIRGLIGDG